MKKVLNFFGSILETIGSAFRQQYFLLLGILWMFISFIYVGDSRFWTILGFGTVFTGIQSVINELKLKQ